MKTVMMIESTEQNEVVHSFLTLYGLSIHLLLLI